eukprot:526747-Rhodomonas_salina.4
MKRGGRRRERGRGAHRSVWEAARVEDGYKTCGMQRALALAWQRHQPTSVQDTALEMRRRIRRCCAWLQTLDHEPRVAHTRPLLPACNGQELCLERLPRAASLVCWGLSELAGREGGSDWREGATGWRGG